ncbi:hypothetical protein [Aestuariibaculum suncheonense]|uniref:Uncharacterized protein n=1 Tax=Aestuariibaculum suncheonense TaxID=1028745 RepID=A0A8J6Q8M7_9FLAO|nr:hypothetical protein [Aestuariibaculum suncheonense]MBD0836119.1 hypothetical protein [Aestuariibaculum suncheonense]
MSDFNNMIEKIKNAPSLDFGNVINQCIEHFKKVWLQGLVTLILNGVLMIPLVFIIYIPMIILALINPDVFEDSTTFTDLGNAGILFIILSAVLFGLVMFLAMSLQIALKAAYFKMVNNKDLGIKRSDDYFFFLKKKYLMKTIRLTLMMFGISILALLCFIIPIFYVIIPLSYMVVIYGLNPDLSEREIIKIGFALGNKKWFITFLLVFVAWLMSSTIGFLMCFIGIYVTQQFVDLPFYEVYKKSIGFSETHVIDEIGTSVE